MKIINAYRLGQYNDTKQGIPLRIIFEEKNTINKLFKNISNLKESEEKYKRISIQRELSISELEAFQKKIAETKEKNKTHTDSKIYYVVRGTPNIYEIKTITTRKKSD